MEIWGAEARLEKTIVGRKDKMVRFDGMVKFVKSLASPPPAIISWLSMFAVQQRPGEIAEVSRKIYQ
jgi:hypothetical protein